MSGPYCLFQSERGFNAVELLTEGFVNLEALYRLFNGDQRPFAHRMRSMSVSDLVEVVDSEGADVEPGLYFCDSIGFKKIY